MKITKHAFERVTERGFTTEMLGAVLNGNPIVRCSENGDTMLVSGFADGKRWTLIVTKDLKKLITVRRSHKGE